MNKVFQRVSFTADANVRRELARAHLIIVVLALSILTLLVMVTTFELTIDTVLGEIAGAGAALVALISLGIFLNLSKAPVKVSGKTKK